MKINKFISLGLILGLQIGAFVFLLHYIKQQAGAIQLVHNELIAWEQKKSDLSLLQNTYYQEKEVIDIINEALPDNDQAVNFFKDLESKASKSRVSLDIKMLSPPQYDQNENVETFLLNLELKGSFAAILDFIKEIENMNQLVLVRQTVFNSPGGLSAEVRATVFIKTFFNVK